MLSLDATSVPLHRDEDPHPPSDHAMHSASLIARLILLIAEDKEDPISNQKLQKLLYYSQGLHLALHGSPLFPEEIRSWTLGPAVPEVWDTYEECFSGAIPFKTGLDLDAFSEQELEVVKQAYARYGQYAEWKLRDMAHEEAPWADTKRGAVISHSKLGAFFEERLG